MLQVWMRSQHSPLLVWQATTQQWQMVSDWQQLQEDYAGYKSGHKSTQDKRLCLYFPSNYMLQVETLLSASQIKQLGESGQQYLFEESSITPVDQLIVRQQSYSNSHHLYALASSDSDAWQQSAVLAGFRISALLPDFLLLPIPEEGAGQQLVMYQDEQTTLLRQSHHQGMSINYFPLVLERLPHLSEVCLVKSVPELPTVIAIQSTSDIASDSINNDNEAKGTIDNTHAQTTALLAEQQILLTYLNKQPIPIDTPDRYALNFFIKISSTTLSPYLRVAAMVALSALVLQMATDGLQTYRYHTASEATQAATAIQFQSWFPEDRLNSRTQLQTQMKAKLRSDSQAPASHMALLARLSPLIKQSSLRAQALVMQPTSLSFTLIAPNRESLDQFTNTLTTQGLVANLDRVNGNEQGEFSGQITVDIAEDGNRVSEPSLS